MPSRIQQPVFLTMPYRPLCAGAAEATRQEDLAQPDRPKNIRGLTQEQMARMERDMDGLQR
jgi:hypothetical protein